MNLSQTKFVLLVKMGIVLGSLQWVYARSLGVFRPAPGTLLFFQIQFLRHLPKLVRDFREGIPEETVIALTTDPADFTVKNGDFQAQSSALDSFREQMGLLNEALRMSSDEGRPILFSFKIVRKESVGKVLCIRLKKADAPAPPSSVIAS